MKYKIYKLVYNDNVIYVGYTKLKYLSMRKAVWYDRIPIEIKKESSIELIEETDDISRERYWISYYRKLGNLYNIKNGDGYKVSVEYDKYKKEWYKNNKDILKDKHKLYYENNKEHLSEKSKEWYENNKERKKDSQRLYSKNEKRINYLKKYKKDNKDEINRKRREKRKLKNERD